MSYDKKHKEKVIEYLEKGNTQEETAKTFGIGTTTIKEWKKQLAKTGNLEKKATRNRKSPKIPREKLEAYITEKPEAYLSEIAKAFNCTGEGVRKAMKKLKITRKKRV